MRNSYQDADMHSGNTYRFDGWTRIGFSSSGTDIRSGRKGRRKWIWHWGQTVPANALAQGPGGSSPGPAGATGYA